MPNTAQVLSSHSADLRRKARLALRLKVDIERKNKELAELRQYFVNEAAGNTLVEVVPNVGRVTVTARTPGKVVGIDEVPVFITRKEYDELPEDRRQMLIDMGVVKIERVPRTEGGAEPSFRLTLND